MDSFEVEVDWEQAIGQGLVHTGVHLVHGVPHFSRQLIMRQEDMRSEGITAGQKERKRQNV